MRAIIVLHKLVSEFGLVRVKFLLKFLVVKALHGESVYLQTKNIKHDKIIDLNNF